MSRLPLAVWGEAEDAGQKKWVWLSLGVSGKYFRYSGEFMESQALKIRFRVSCRKGAGGSYSLYMEEPDVMR